MRIWIVAIVLVAAACKGGKKEKAAQQQAAKAAVVVAKIDAASALAKETGAPPFLYIVDDAGVRIAAAASWTDLDAGKLKIAKKPTPLDYLDRLVREDFALGRQPSDTVKSMDEYADDPGGGVAIDLAALEDTSTRTNPSAQDDPPPPEEEDLPEDGEDMGGGPGTTIALDEGKMGKKESDRAEGQYKMQKNQEDPQLARQQAIEQARNAGILGRPSGGGGPPGLDIYKRPNEDGTPSRVAQVQGSIAADSSLERFRTMIFIAPTAKATKLIEAIAESDGAIAVSHNGKIRPLRVQFDMRDWSDAKEWVEARVSTKGLVIEAVPDAPIDVADIKQLAASLDTARKSRGTDSDAPVDILVEPDVDVQRMIDVLVALDTAGVRTIGLGSSPNAEEVARRGHRIPSITFGQPNSMGDLDKTIIRRVIREARPKLLACYTKVAATNPDLEGTVASQFFIKPDGKVAMAAAIGLDPDVANCVGEVIKRLEFPKPKGGGGVQVNYPFTFRP